MPRAEQLTRSTTYTSSIHHAAMFIAVDGFFSLEEDEAELALKIAQLTPTTDKLRLLAASRQMPDARFNDDQTCPF